jgi:hypothetical protein
MFACVHRAHQQTSQFKFRAENLISKYGNDLAKGRAGIKPENPKGSDADLYEDIRFEIMITDWIGPITTSLEVWEMRNNIPTLREQPIVSLYQPALLLV